MSSNPNTNSSRIDPEACDQLLQELSVIPEGDRARAATSAASTAAAAAAAAAASQYGQTAANDSAANINQPFINDLINGTINDILNNNESS